MGAQEAVWPHRHPRLIRYRRGRGTYCKVWSSTEDVSPLPSEQFLTACLVVLVLASLVAVLAIKNLRPHVLRRLLKNAGVVANKVATTAREIERKTFHLCGPGSPHTPVVAATWCVASFLHQALLVDNTPRHQRGHDAHTCAPGAAELANEVHTAGSRTDRALRW